MKHLFLFCLLFAFPLPLISYQLTMTTVWGTPDPTSVIFDNKSLTWDDCVQSCFERENCAMVHQEKDSENCNSYSYGDVWRVDKDTADKVSIKVTMEDDNCFENPSMLFSSTVFASFVPTSTFTSFSVVPTDQYYTFSYISSVLPNGCKDWLQLELDCNCLDTMIYFLGPGFAPNRTFVTSSWKECMFLCWNDPICFMIYMEMGSDECHMKDNGRMKLFFKKTSRFGVGHNQALKLTLTTNTCNLQYPEIINNHRFTSPPGFSHKSFQIRNSSHPMFFGVNWIGENDVIDEVLPFEDGSPGGFMIYNDIQTYDTKAYEYCTTVGDNLLPMKSLNWLKTVSEVAFRNKKSIPLNDFWNDANGRFLIGLKKIDGVWTWSTPRGTTFDAPDLMWADGHPLPNQTCAWLVVTDFESTRGRTLQSRECKHIGEGAFCYVNLLEEGF